MPSWHVAASGEGGMKRRSLTAAIVLYQPRPSAPCRSNRKHVLKQILPYPQETECLKHHGRDGTARDLASNDTQNEQGDEACL